MLLWQFNLGDTVTLDGPADGDTFDSSRDEERLNTQRRRLWAVISDGQWHTAGELEEAVGANWAALSARVRDLRKPRFGGHTIESQCVRRGLWRYRYVAPSDNPLAKVYQWAGKS